jgi:acetoin utilization deacetylase AcuC-like enzyme
LFGEVSDMESEYLVGHGRFPLTVLEICLFFAALLLLTSSSRWPFSVGLLLALYVTALTVCRFWPAPTFKLPQAPRSSGPAPVESPARGTVVWSPEYQVRFWFHPFSARKYGLIRERALREGLLSADDFSQPVAVDDRDLRLVHSRGYLWRLYLLGLTPLGLLNGENPVQLSILKRLKAACGGTYLAARIALERGLAVNLGGGFHHAFACHEEGFCHLNDIAVAIRKLQEEGAIERAMVIDCDVHQGNGTAAIFQGDESVFTFSIHREDLYPHRKIPSSYDIGLYSHEQVGDDRYLRELEVLPALVERHRPDLVVYVAGADPFRGDRLGGLLLSKEGLMARDSYVLRLCTERHIPAAVVLGGGYSKGLRDTVEIHVNTIRVMALILREAESRSPIEREPV